MNRGTIGTLAGLLVGWIVYSSAPHLVEAMVLAVFAVIVTKLIVVWLLAITNDLGLSAPKSEPPAETWPELLRAADGGNAERVSELLKAGADPNVERDDGYAALHMASWKGHAEIAAALIEAGSDVNKAVEGRVPLHIAASEGHLACMELFVSHGTTVDRISDDGTTPLGAAAAAGHIDAMRLLLSLA